MSTLHHETAIKIGPLIVNIISSNFWIKAFVEERFKDYVCEPADGMTLRFSDYKVPDISTVPETRIYRSGRRLIGERGDFQVDIDMDSQQGEAKLLVESLPGLVLILKMAFTASAIAQKGLFLHAGATKLNGVGYVFPGRSGVGKSTLVSRLKEHEALTDEFTLLVKQDELWNVYSTPFHGEFSAGRKAGPVPLKSVMFIARGEPMCLSAISKSEAIFRLMQNVVGWGFEDQIPDALDLASGIAHQSESFVLKYSLKDDPGSLFH